MQTGKKGGLIENERKDVMTKANTVTSRDRGACGIFCSCGILNIPRNPKDSRSAVVFGTGKIRRMWHIGGNGGVQG